MRALTEKPEGYVEPKGGRGPRREGGSDKGERRDRGERRGGERGERHGGERRGGDRQDRGERRSFGPRREQAPAPQADDYKEPVEEIF